MISVKLTTDTTLTGMLLINIVAPATNPDPVNVIVCPPAGSAAVSSPG